MSQKLKNYLLTVVGSLTLLAPLLVSGTVSAAAGSLSNVGNGITSQACTGINSASNANTTPISLNPSAGSGSCVGDQSAGGTLGNIINTVINVFSIVVGAVSVIMIIVGGFRYITSGGNDTSIAGAKNTIVYALIGLVIVVLAQVIVHYLINRLGTVGTSS